MIANLTQQTSAQLSPSGLRQYRPVRSKTSSSSFKTSANQNHAVWNNLVFLDKNKLLRCWGWLNNATLSSDNKNPILLPSKHSYVELIIRQTHETVKQNSVNNTLTAIRERFWILRGRQAVKRMLKHCVTCRRLKGVVYSSYKVPNLPSVPRPAIHTYRGNSTTERDSNKCYVCLFTCALMRAVHLKLTPNLLLSLSRGYCFTSCRGLPAPIMEKHS